MTGLAIVRERHITTRHSCGGVGAKGVGRLIIRRSLWSKRYRGAPCVRAALHWLLSKAVGHLVMHSYRIVRLNAINTDNSQDTVVCQGLQQIARYEDFVQDVTPRKGMARVFRRI